MTTMTAGLRVTKRRLADAVHPERRSFADARWRLASKFLQGDGLEIGALHHPLRLPKGAHARYVDRYDVPDLRRHYPELADLPLVPVDVVDDGEVLASVPDESVDFVVANHFMEHCQDPIGALEHHLRVLRPGGVLYVAIPDKRRTFDEARPVTTLQHVIRDHTEGPAWSREDHYAEWAREVSRVLNDIPDHLVDQEAKDLESSDYSIHFHVWTPIAWLELLAYLAHTHPLDILECVQNQHEFVTVMRKEE
jgi:predicted SAM-dependent methyltransferase